MITGSIVALVTPMQDDAQQSVDETRLRELVDYHIEQQTDAIVAVGTTGESATLDHEEHCRVIEIVIEQANKRIPVIAGTGANSTREALELTKFAHQAGADACLIVTPYYNKPTQEGLYQHYRLLAESVAIPQILYNVPSRTACDMLPVTVERLKAIDNIIGIKEAVSDMPRIEAVIKLADDDFAVYSGDDATAMELILRGGHGTVSVVANVAPQKMHQMCTHALAGEREAASALNQQLMALHNDLFIESSPIPAKWCVQQLGLMGGAIRLPLLPLSEAHHETLRQSMRQAGVMQ